MENDNEQAKTVVRKYELEITGKQKIDTGRSLPTVLSVKELKGKLIMWVQLELDYMGVSTLDVYIVGDEELYEPKGQFAGTAILPSGTTCHVFTDRNYVQAGEDNNT